MPTDTTLGFQSERKKPSFNFWDLFKPSGFTDIPMNRRTPPNYYSGFDEYAGKTDPNLYWGGKENPSLDPKTIEQINYVKSLKQQEELMSMLDQVLSMGSQPSRISIPKSNPEDMKDLKEAIARYQKREGQLDLTPLMALTDAWTGSNFASSYKKPESGKDIQEKTLALKTKLAERESIDNYKQQMLAQQAAALEDKSNSQAAYRDLQLKLGQMRSQGKEKDPLKQAQARLNMDTKSFKQYQLELADLASKITPEDPSGSAINSLINGIAINTGTPQPIIINRINNDPNYRNEFIKQVKGTP